MILAKKSLREMMKAKRRLLHKAYPEAGELLALRGHSLLEKSQKIAFYVPMGSEIDPWPLVHGLSCDVSLCLPDLDQEGGLIFRPFQRGDLLRKTAWGFDAPRGDECVFPDTLLVPLLAFDHRLYRLGYGQGHYDRAIAALKKRGTLRTLGLAFEGQKVDFVPAETHDQPLDFVVTEQHVYS